MDPGYINYVLLPLLQAVSLGPVAVYWAIDAFFMLYSGGIYNSSVCKTVTDHASKK